MVALRPPAHSTWATLRPPRSALWAIVSAWRTLASNAAVRLANGCAVDVERVVGGAVHARPRAGRQAVPAGAGVGRRLGQQAVAGGLGAALEERGHRRQAALRGVLGDDVLAQPVGREEDRAVDTGSRLVRGGRDGQRRSPPGRGRPAGAGAGGDGKQTSRITSRRTGAHDVGGGATVGTPARGAPHGARRTWWNAGTLISTTGPGSPGGTTRDASSSWDMVDGEVCMVVGGGADGNPSIRAAGQICVDAGCSVAAERIPEPAGRAGGLWMAQGGGGGATALLEVRDDVLRVVDQQRRGPGRDALPALCLRPG